MEVVANSLDLSLLAQIHETVPLPHCLQHLTSHIPPSRSGPHPPGLCYLWTSHHGLRSWWLLWPTRPYKGLLWLGQEWRELVPHCWVGEKPIMCLNCPTKGRPMRGWCFTTSSHPTVWNNCRNTQLPKMLKNNCSGSSSQYCGLLHCSHHLLT